MTDSAYKAELRRQLVAAAVREQQRSHFRPQLPRWRALVAVGAAAAAVLAIAFALTAVRQGADDRGTVTRPAIGRTEPLFGGTLDKGIRYRTRVLEPRLSFVPGDDRWFADVADMPDAVILRHEPPDSAPPQALPHGWLAIGRPGAVVDPTNGRIVPAPAHMVAWLTHHPELRVLHRGRTAIGGRPATVIDTVVTFRRPARRGTDCERRYLSPVQPLDGPIIPCTTLMEGFQVPRGMHQRWFVVANRGLPLVIEYDGFPVREYRKLKPAADALVGSIRFER